MKYALVLLALALAGCKEDPPCEDSVQVVTSMPLNLGSIRGGAAVCDSRAKMTVEKMAQGAIVTCTCRRDDMVRP